MILTIIGILLIPFLIKGAIKDLELQAHQIKEDEEKKEIEFIEKNNRLYALTKYLELCDRHGQAPQVSKHLLNSVFHV